LSTKNFVDREDFFLRRPNVEESLAGLNDPIPVGWKRFSTTDDTDFHGWGRVSAMFVRESVPTNPWYEDGRPVPAHQVFIYYPDSGIDDTLGGPFARQRRCSLGQRPLRASFLAPAWPTAKIPRQFLSSIPLSG
jgi:hypothetical protein